MTDELVAYLLDDLGPERRAEVERRLNDDGDWHREFERLKQCFAATGDPAKCVEQPPRDLVKRTCCLVRTAGMSARRPRSAMSAATASGNRASSWSFADLAVAGGVVLALGMLVAPALRESRDAARRIACQDNLRALGSGLYDYQENHGHWLPPIAPQESTNLFAVALADIVGMDREELESRLVCPDSPEAEQIARGQRTPYVPTRDEIDRANRDEMRRLLYNLPVSYAYRAGYEDSRGRYHQPKYTGSSEEIMLADAPTVSAAGVRSTNHAGGQNVLSQLIQAEFKSNCTLAANLDNIFLNARGEHAAGCGKGDVVLIRGDFAPAGRIVYFVLVAPESDEP